MRKPDYSPVQRSLIEKGWTVFVDGATRSTVLAELLESLKYEIGSKRLGRPPLAAKALIMEEYVKCYSMSTEDARRWLADACIVSRGVRYGGLLARSRDFELTFERRLKVEQAVDIFRARRVI